MKNNWILVLSFLIFSLGAQAQNVVKWSFSTENASAGEANLIFTGAINDGFYTYSQFLESEDGPIPTSITFEPGSHYQLIGKAVESGEKISVYDKVFGMNLTKFKHKAIFTQKVKVLDASKPIKGYLTFMACNDEMCYPPKDVDFNFALPAATPAAGTTPPPANNTKPGTTPSATPPTPSEKANGNTPQPNEKKNGETALNIPAVIPGVITVTDTTKQDTATTTATTVLPTPPNDENFKGFFDSKRAAINSNSFVNNCGTTAEKSSSLFWIFVAGFLGGLIALLTPCVFPMIPLTVTYFLKGSKEKSVGFRNALWYGFFIVAIYTAMGIGLTVIFGPRILNEMSTDMYFNLLFFVVFIIFALSFFGLFEIQLPSSWVSKSDKMADKGGLLGIFFMAFTLALVSFSCTGPIVGTLLVETAKATEASEAFLGFIPTKPAIGLFGFGLALALPFALFAAFPTWLKSLPKSGGWMDNVKVTLGFLELALAFKFLSTADMVRHWGILKFELFIGIWLLLAVLLALYQFGIIKMKGNEKKPGVPRLIVGGLATIAALYLVDGLFNYKSLSALSGIAPPVHYNFFRPMDCPHSLECYKDFDEGLAAAKAQNKPLFVDFTGHGCVNCRKMEETVWHKDGIIQHLRDNYVVVSLYVDDQARLFPDNKFQYLLDPNTQEKMRTKGDKWGQFQVNNFGTSSQPYYVLMHNDGTTLLNSPVAYTPDVDAYKSFLDCGFDAFKKIQTEQKAGQLIGQK